MRFGRKGKGLSDNLGSAVNPEPPLFSHIASNQQTMSRLELDLPQILPGSGESTPVNYHAEDIATININRWELFFPYRAADNDIYYQSHLETALINPSFNHSNYIEARLDWNYNPSLSTADTVSQTQFTDGSLTPIQEILEDVDLGDWGSTNSEGNRPGARVTVQYVRPRDSPVSVETKRLIVLAYQSIYKTLIRIIHRAPNPPKEPSTPHPRFSPYPPSLPSEAESSTIICFKPARTLFSRAFHKTSSIFKTRRNSS